MATAGYLVSPTFGFVRLVRVLGGTRRKVRTMSNLVRARVVIKGTRTLLQHAFGPESIPLEKGERTGVAGNDPDEWKKTCLVNSEDKLYFPSTYIFGCLRNGSVHTKRGRGSLQPLVVSTLQIEDDVIVLNRTKPPDKELKKFSVLTPDDPEAKVFIYVAPVKNPATKGRNIRYRLATVAGWKATFTLCWDKTIVPREQMKAILRDAGTLGGIGDGIRIGCGRFAVVSYEELDNAENETAEGDLESHKRNGLAKGREKVRSVRE